MWLAMLINEFPELAEKMKRKLMYYVRKTEAKSRAEPGSYSYRSFRPDDSGIGGTQYVYWSTFNTATAENFLSQSTALTVPTANAYVSFGWYIDFEPGTGGYCQSVKNNVTKSEVPARMVYQAKNPKHMYLDFDHVIYGEEQDIINFIIYQDAIHAGDQDGMGLPILFRIGSKSALNLLPGG